MFKKFLGKITGKKNTESLKEPKETVEIVVKKDAMGKEYKSKTTIIVPKEKKDDYKHRQ